MNSSQTKILTLEQLLKKLKKRQDLKVVFTNGCFDILHAGHVAYLEAAKKLGSVLIVALNSDASTKRLKGPTRPVNSLRDRARVIAGLASVDYVIAFGEDTPLKPIQKILPDVLVKGGDYKAPQIVGFKEVTENGGVVKVVSFLKGRSTTNTIRKMQTK